MDPRGTREQTERAHRAAADSGKSSARKRKKSPETQEARKEPRPIELKELQPLDRNEHSEPLDREEDPGIPFLYWDQLKKNTIYRVMILLNKPTREKILGTLIHELVVHAMQYRPMIEQFRITDNLLGEIPLLYHYHLDKGTISGKQHHETHGSKATTDEPIRTAVGTFKPSGFPAFNDQVVHMITLMGTKQDSHHLLAAVNNDVGMQEKGGGNLVADFVFPENSLGLMIGYLQGLRLQPDKIASCEQTVGLVTAAWRKAFEAYLIYKAINDEEPYKSNAGKKSTKVLPKIKGLDTPQPYAAFRAKLEIARDKDPRPWLTLLETLKKFK